MDPISERQAEAFAKALVTHSGNRSAAARELGYTEPRSAGHQLARHPEVLKRLQPLAMQQLQSLTPRAITTLAGLLSNKSGYIRLEAAKDILNRNGVGAAKDGSSSQPLLISISIGSQTVETGQSSVALVAPEPQSDADRPGGRKLASEALPRSPAHDFSEKVEPSKASRVIDIAPSQEDSFDWEL